MTTNATPYTPRPGSKAEAAVAALSRTPWLSANDLASAMECDRLNVDGNLETAIRHGAIRRVARSGKAGFMLGGSDEPPPDEDTPPALRERSRRAKAKKAAPAPRQVEHKAKPNGDYIEYGHHVGICEDGRVVVIDSGGHVLELSADAARRVAELVMRTS
jgi:hypothetical protein